MDETQKMTALKKAYAEIILNTAKEAAARIMASERKSHQFHYDLTSTKEEALRLLLRQKQTMDSKINEAEMKSLNQQRRIEELEAQLQEAEDIVSNLRVELNEAHTMLEEMANNQTKNSPKLTERAHSEEGTEQPENGQSEAVSAAQTNSLDVSTNGHYVSNNSLAEFGYSVDPVVPSIILRSKKPELYRNSCTQRVRAYEGSLIDGQFSLSGESDDLKNVKLIREDKESEGIYIAPIVAHTTFSSGKKLFDDQEVKNVDKGSSVLQASKTSYHGRKRAARSRRRNASTLNAVPHLSNQTLSNLSNSQPCLTSFHGIRDTGDASDDTDKDTLLHSPSVLQSSVAEMGVLSEIVPTARGDETEARVVVADEDTVVASSLNLIKQQSGSADCLNDSSVKQDLRSGSMLQELKSRSHVRKRAVRYSRRRNPSALNAIPLLGNETLSDRSNSQPCLTSSNQSHDMHETNDESDDIDKDKLPHSPSILQSEHIVTNRGDEIEAHVDVMNEETDVACSLNLIKQESGSGNCLSVSSSKQDLEMNNCSSVNLNPTLLEAGDGFSSPPPKDRVLKYTFQRKRKRESISGDDSSFHPENALKRNMVKKQNGDLEPPKSSAAYESSRDSRRMAQVARQLISLSEKKWWT